MKFLVMQIGCIECGVSSFPVKVCGTLEEAKRLKKAHPSTWDSEGGDGYTTIIDLTKCETLEQDDE